MSSVIDEDTARTIQDGRATVADMLSTAQEHGQRVFTVFLLGLIGTIFALRGTALFGMDPLGDGVWGFLRENTKSRMAQHVAANVDIIARNPFDVILIQVKVGLFVGIALCLPLILYYSRHALRRRGVTSAVPVSKWKVAGFAGLSTVLFFLGLFYAYAVFFPFMFSFLASNAISASIKPSYDIVMYVKFLLMLTVSFGVAAQLPLFMSALSYTEIVSYEFFRDKWRYAVLIIFFFGAVASPPDPFTQVMWGIPLVGLYGFSLGLAKLVTNVRRRGEADAGVATVKTALVRLAVLFVASIFAGYSFAYYDGFAYVNAKLLPAIPAIVRPGPLTVQTFVDATGGAGDFLFGLLVGSVVLFVTLMALVIWVLRQPVEPRRTGVGSGSAADIDLSELDAAGIRAAPPEAFAEMSEEEALGLAQGAIEENDHEKGQAILDRFDEAEEQREAEAEAAEEQADASAAGSDGTAVAEGDRQAAAEDDESNVFTSTAAGMADAFTEEETTEDDIGGYYYDLRFIFESLTSKMFRIIGVFMATIGISFYWLYQGGLGQLQRTFVDQLSWQVRGQLSTEVDLGHGWYITGTHLYDFVAAKQKATPSFVVALHPVEHIIFSVKVSVIIAAIVTLPLVLYYAWPALRERNFVGESNRNVFVAWGGSLILGIVGGSLFGFFFVAPTVITYLVEDAIMANMIISYRLNAFLWLVLYTTAGLGILAEIPVTMFLFDRASVVPYETMYKYSREIMFAVFVSLTFLTPSGLLMTFLIAIPIVLAFAAGLFVLWFLTLPRRIRQDGLGGVFPS